MINSIVIKDLAVECIIGIHAWERSTPQTLYIDLEAFFDFTNVLHSRSIKDTVDYVKVAKIVEQVAKEGKYNLLEPLASDLAKALFKEFPLTSLEIEFKKSTPDVANARHVGISFRIKNHPSSWRGQAPQISPPESKDLTGKVALITGSAKGLGKSFAQHLAKNGCHVAIHYQSSRLDAEHLAEDLRKLDVSAHAFQGELGSSSQMKTLVSQVIQKFAGVDILINNVGAYTSKSLSEISPEEFEQIIQTNINGTFFLTREVLPSMREKGFGRIINIGQTACDRVNAHPVETPYHMSKTAILILTKTLAKMEGRNGITCNMISPGILVNSSYFPPNLDEKIPLGRIAEFQDIWGTLYFLLSPAANYITGANIEVTGGYGL